ncbi:MAG: exodeoxyribonuclease VII large subunit [Lachnospiraceae bacterium]
MPARSLFPVHTPVISAVGHETDTTTGQISVADLAGTHAVRLAAELAVADATAWLQALDEDALQLQRIMQRMIKDAPEPLAGVQGAADALREATAAWLDAGRSKRLDEYREERLRRAAMQSLLEQRLAISWHSAKSACAGSLLAKSREAAGRLRFNRGRETDPVPYCRSQPGEVVQICLADGRMTARIQEVKETKIDGGKT